VGCILPARGRRYSDRGYLPHWTKEGGVYHVCFRLADSLPKQTIELYHQDRERVLAEAQKQKGNINKAQQKRLDELFSDKIEAYLNSGQGKCYLKQPEVAQIVVQALKYYQNEKYQLFCWCIMPNHVHVLVKPLEDFKLQEILHSWKSFTAHEANKILGRKGPFWQREYYDHLIRDEEEFYHTVKYITENPCKAKLENWQWFWWLGKDQDGKDKQVFNIADGTVGLDVGCNAGVPPARGDEEAFNIAGQRPALQSGGVQSAGQRPALQSSNIAGQRPALRSGGVQSAAETAALQGTFGPEDVLAYIYAVFHSPAYRKRYAEFLKIDFPRVPMPAGKVMFRKFAESGHELMGLHLLEADVLEDESKRPAYPNEGDNIVEKGYPKYIVEAGKESKGRVYINKDQYFEGVRPTVWEFHIGGYQVCEKWLKDRRGRELSYDDISHYQKVAVALGETIRIMKQKFINEPWE